MYTRVGEFDQSKISPSEERWAADLYDPVVLKDLKEYCRQLHEAGGLAEREKELFLKRRADFLQPLPRHRSRRLGSGGVFRDVTAEVQKDVRQWLCKKRYRQAVHMEGDVIVLSGKGPQRKRVGTTTWLRRRTESSHGDHGLIGPVSHVFDLRKLNDIILEIDSKRSVAEALALRRVGLARPTYVDVLSNSQEQTRSKERRGLEASNDKDVLSEFKEKRRQLMLQKAHEQYRQEAAESAAVDDQEDLQIQLPNYGKVQDRKLNQKQFRRVKAELDKKRKEAQRKMRKNGTVQNMQPMIGGTFSMKDLSSEMRETIMLDMANACRTGDVTVLTEIVGFGLRVEEQYEGRSLFFIAFLAALDGVGGPSDDPIGHQERFESVLSFLVRCGADVNAMEDAEVYCGYRPLHYAARLGNVYWATKLLEWGADINERSFLGHTPLHVAAMSGKFETLLLLIGNKAEMSAVDMDGNDVLHHAAICGNANIVRFLLRLGLDKNRSNNIGHSASDLGFSHGNYEAADIIRTFAMRMCSPAEWLAALERTYVQ